MIHVVGTFFILLSCQLKSLLGEEYRKIKETSNYWFENCLKEIKLSPIPPKKK